MQHPSYQPIALALVLPLPAEVAARVSLPASVPGERTAWDAGGAGSFEGRREFFAESLSVLITFATEEALLRYDAEWISFLKREVLR
mgnify:CR=1 FL=1